MRTSSFKTLAAVVPMALAVTAGLSMAAPYTVFSDNFSGDTATFAYPDTVGHPPAAPQVGTWGLSDPSTPQVAAGIITNTPPGGGANGNTHYMAMERTASNYNFVAAQFSIPVTAANGTLDIQWDEYTSDAYNNWLSTTTNFNQSSNVLNLMTRNYPSSPANSLFVYTNNYNTSQSFPYTNSAWDHMEMQVNIAAQTYKLFLNNTQLGGDFAYNAAQSPGYGIQEMVWGGVFADKTLYLDNIVATVTNGPVVPEPVSGSLLLGGGMLMLLRRKRG